MGRVRSERLNRDKRSCDSAWYACARPMSAACDDGAAAAFDHGFLELAGATESPPGSSMGVARAAHSSCSCGKLTQVQAVGGWRAPSASRSLWTAC